MNGNGELGLTDWLQITKLRFVAIRFSYREIGVGHVKHASMQIEKPVLRP